MRRFTWDGIYKGTRWRTDMIYDSGVISEEEDAEIRQMFNDIAYELTSTAYFNYANASGQIHNYNADRISGLTLYMLTFPENKGTKKNNYKDNFDFFYDHIMNEKTYGRSRCF